MSKKDKSKFRKRLKAQIQQSMASTQVTPTINKPATVTSGDNIQSTSTIIQSDSETEKMLWVKKDLKKSAIIIGSIIIVIVSLFFLDQKFGFLIKAGSEVFKVLHIGA